MFPETVTDPTADTDRRYTTRETLDLCMRLARVEGFDLDVAADAEAHVTERYFDRAADGLQQRWSGRVWCNPPFSDIEPWIRKAWAEMGRWEGAPSTLAMLLPAWTDRAWWAELVEPHRDRRHWMEGNGNEWARAVRLDTHFLRGRTIFGHPGNREAVGCGSPPFWCVLLVWRPA